MNAATNPTETKKNRQKHLLSRTQQLIRTNLVGPQNFMVIIKIINEFFEILNGQNNLQQIRCVCHILNGFELKLHSPE